jgi:hypothetical protein
MTHIHLRSQAKMITPSTNMPSTSRIPVSRAIRAVIFSLPCGWKQCRDVKYLIPVVGRKCV